MIKSWKAVQANIGKFNNHFKQNLIIVDNNEAGEDVFQKVYKRIRNLVTKKPTKRQAKQWIANELKKKDRR